MNNSINCPVCNNLCSTQAVTCPKCGHPINQTNQKTEASNKPAKQVSTGSILTGFLWVFFAISLFYALGAIPIYNSKPAYIRGIFGDWDNSAQVNQANFAIGVHIAPLVIMIIILAIVYSSRDRK